MLNRCRLTSFKHLLALLLIVALASCSKLKEYSQAPELGSLQQGIKTSAAIGYCVSVATAVHKGQALPGNVEVMNSGLIYIHVDSNHPLPFNRNVGDIVIASLWNGNGGIMSILLANVDILGGSIKLYGLHTVPFTEQLNGNMLAIFARQDIVLGSGSDTLLNIGDLTDIAINTEMERLKQEKPTDQFVAVKQNVWFIDVNTKGTPANVYDDNIVVNGGGQIAEVKGESGGIIYHAMIDMRINALECTRNPDRKSVV